MRILTLPQLEFWIYLSTPKLDTCLVYHAQNLKSINNPNNINSNNNISINNIIDSNNNNNNK